MTTDRESGGPPPLTHTLITGASAGIGLELARLFAAAGQPLVLVARRGERLAALAETLRRDYEIESRVVVLDLVAPGAVDRLVAELAAARIGIRVLVNNAGVGAYSPFLDRDADSAQHLIDLNIAVPTRLARLLLPAMLAQADAPGPRVGVLNVASTAAFQPGPLMAVYFASKAYVLHFSEALNEELRGSGVTVTAFCPGPTRSEFFATGDMIPAEAYDEAGNLKPAAAAEFGRRDDRRMDTAVAARAGYDGFLAGRAVVIPGWTNRLTAQAHRFLPRGVMRRIVHRALDRKFD